MLFASSQRLRHKISALTLPEHANPLLVLIHGDSQQLAWEINYAKNDDPVPSTEEELAQLTAKLSAEIIEKLQTYLTDWETGNHYHYSFSLNVTYASFKSERDEIEYVDINKRTRATTIPELISEAKAWEERLPERVTLYKDRPQTTIGYTALHHL